MDHQFVPSCDNISNDIQNDSNENSVVEGCDSKHVLQEFKWLILLSLIPGK